MRPDSSVDLERRLAELLTSMGSDFPVDTIREDIATTLRETRADDAAHGSETTRFYSFSAWRGVAVFTFYASGLEIYVVPFEPEKEWNLIGKFESLAMADVDEARELLHDNYGKASPDIDVDPRLASKWLGIAGGDLGIE